MPRRRYDRGVPALLLAALVALLVGAAVSTSAAAAVAAGSPQAVAAPGTGENNGRTIVVSESTDLPATGAAITVAGTGFGPVPGDLYVAVCAASIKATDELTACVGGGIPKDNKGKAWALITGSKDGKKNTVDWGADGSFSAPLTVDAASGSSVNCVKDGCVVIARAADRTAGLADITVPLQFAQPATTTATTESLPAGPTTVGPDAVALPTAVQGDQQTVVFAGFTPGEAVDVKVFSDPITIPGISASSAGIVTISFRVSSDLFLGQHTVQAIGAQSRTVGLANFTVVAPPPVSTSAATSTPATTPSSAPETTSSAALTTATATTATATASSAAAPVTSPDSGGSLWWLWVTLGLLLIVGAVTGLIALSRRRAALLEQENENRDDQLAAAMEPSAQVWPPDQPWQTGSHRLQDPDQAGGLLSGRTPDDGPALYSGQGGRQVPGDPVADAPTQWIPIPPVEPGTPDQPTQAPDPGPGTAQWSPFDTDTDTDTDGDTGGDQSRR